MPPKGFTRPFSSSGNASLVPALPWRFAGDLYVIHFKTNPDTIANLLPNPLTPSDKPDEAFLWSTHFAVYPDNNNEINLINPSRTQYNVVVIGLPCKFNGKNTMLSAFQWCDKDWLVMMSWFLGACSKMAQIEESKTHPLMSVTNSCQTGDLGTIINRWASRNGEKIINFSITPSKNINISDLKFYTDNLPLTCERHFPDVHYPPSGKPEVHDLCQMVMKDTEFGKITAGEATLNFGIDENEEVHLLQPTKVLGGYVLPMGFKLMGINTIHNFL